MNEILNSQRPSILFVCHGNTCRSFMAEALSRKKLGSKVQVMSAGLEPQPAADAKTAIDTLSTYFDIDASGHVPRTVWSLDLNAFDYVIAMVPSIAKELKGAVAEEKLLTWNIPDPWDEDLMQYKNCALKINREISKLHF
jgi:ArsR family transcriptional regulator, arsenate/arsenite/antimonite-responsive transcriptional repressor / arsenate reductase (thioredoxin)